MAKGFAQHEGIDYDETFAPTAKWNTIRTVINLAAQHGWKGTLQEPPVGCRAQLSTKGQSFKSLFTCTSNISLESLQHTQVTTKATMQMMLVADNMTSSILSRHYVYQ
jgi:hypothetical protein